MAPEVLTACYDLSSFYLIRVDLYDSIRFSSHSLTFTPTSDLFSVRDLHIISDTIVTSTVCDIIIYSGFLFLFLSFFWCIVLSLCAH